MDVIKQVNTVLAFLLELGVLGAVGYWGFTVSPRWVLKLLAGLGAPALFVAVWALFGAPEATHPLTGVGRILLEIGWFGGGALALYAAGAVTLGAVFALLSLVNNVLLHAWHLNP